MVKSLSRAGETITVSAGTVIVAVLCLLLASFGVYQGLGPAQLTPDRVEERECA